jgi:hypothetical protein
MLNRKQSLEERIKELREALDEAIDARAAEESKRAPGVPILVVRNCLVGRNQDCECRAWLKMSEES